jgi:hypothetical protein
VERKKDGVLEANLIRSGSTSVNGRTYYDVEYSNESTHGSNHYASRIAVQNGKLFVFTVQCKVGDFDFVSEEVFRLLQSFALK